MKYYTTGAKITGLTTSISYHFDERAESLMRLKIIY